MLSLCRARCLLSLGQPRAYLKGYFTPKKMRNLNSNRPISNSIRLLMTKAPKYVIIPTISFMASRKLHNQNAIAIKVAHCVEIGDQSLFWKLLHLIGRVALSMLKCLTKPIKILGFKILNIPRLMILTFIYTSLSLLYLITKIPLIGRPIAYFVWWPMFLEAINYSGPIFVKLAQYSAMRSDLFSEGTCGQLAGLQQNVTYHQWEYTEEKLGPKWEEKLRQLTDSSIDIPCPVGFGCVSQVYKMEHRETKRIVAVKVLHPDIESQLEVNLNNLKFVARLLEFLHKPLKYLNLSGCVQVVEEFAMQQIDLNREGKMLDRFNENFKENSNVVIPKSVSIGCKDVLIETWQDGIAIANMSKHEHNPTTKSKAAKQLIAIFLQMMFKDRLIHADLHPGNILLQSDDELDLKLVLLDFGLVIEPPAEKIQNLGKMLQGLAQNKDELVGQALLETCHEKITLNKEAFQQDIKSLLDYNRSSNRVDVKTLFSKLFSLVLKKHDLKIKSDYPTILIAMIMLERSAKLLDPNFDFLKEADYYLIDQTTPLFKSTL